MRFRKTELAVIASLILAVAAVLLLSARQEDFSQKLIRLHVTAESDSEADQQEKLRVRDAVLDLLEKRLDGVTDRASAERVLSGSLREIGLAAEKTCGKRVTVTLEDEFFPTREYETFSLPAGIYRALRVTIGAGAGRNWWCVVFPPICMGGLETGAAEAVFSPEEIGMVTEISPGCEIRFRVFELIGQLRGILSGA